jgi:DNA-binding NarL/FixJ family response regulator
MTRARILLVDDHELFREGVAKVINSQPDMKVIGQADDGLEALTMAHELHPDLILMDINMPLSDGLEATTLIHSSLPDTSIIMLTAYEEEEKLFDAIKAGAKGYVLKSSSAAGLVRGIRGALAGEASVPRKLAGQLLAEFAKLSKRPDHPVSEDTVPIITQREREVLNIMASGASNQEIAETLSISLQTVKSHVSNILTKLQAKSRLQAAEFGIKQGLIQRKL